MQGPCRDRIGEHMKARGSHLRYAAGLCLSALLLFPAVGARASDSDEHEFHRHHVGVFLGAASRPENGAKRA